MMLMRFLTARNNFEVNQAGARFKQVEANQNPEHSISQGLF